MRKRILPLLSAGLTLWFSQSLAGEINTVNVFFLEKPQSGIPVSIYELRIKYTGKCSLIPETTVGKKLEFLIKNCKIQRNYTIGPRGDFVESTAIYPTKKGAKVKLLLSKEGFLKVKSLDGTFDIKVYSNKFLKPKIFVNRTVKGELVQIEFPEPIPEISYEKSGNKLLIFTKRLYIENGKFRPPSLFIKEVSFGNSPEGGKIEVLLGNNVKAIEVTSSGKRITLKIAGVKKGKAEGKLRVSKEEPKVALKFTNADVRSVVKAIASIAGVNVVFNPNVSGKVDVDFKTPIYWKDALKAVLDPLGLTYVETPEYIRILKKEDISKEEALEPVKTYILPLNYVDANEVAKNITEIVYSGGKKQSREKVTVNSSTNSLILKVTENHYRQILALVKKIDKPAKQVMVKAKLVEVSSSAEKELGFSWYISVLNKIGHDTHAPYIGGSYGYNISEYSQLLDPDKLNVFDLPVTDSTLALGILNKSQTMRVELALKALQLDGDAQVISSPKIMTLDNQEASIEQGVEIPYTESTVGSGGATSYNIEFKKASLILKVKPHITKDGRIILDLEVRKDSPNYDYVAVTGSNEPAINTRNAKSKVIVRNGETVVIGGIYEKEKHVSNTSVPGLSRIPLLGWLFRSKVENYSKKKLLIFITPEIMNSKGEKVE